jgi:hypothetical protein
MAKPVPRLGIRTLRTFGSRFTLADIDMMFILPYADDVFGTRGTTFPISTPPFPGNLYALGTLYLFVFTFLMMNIYYVQCLMSFWVRDRGFTKEFPPAPFEPSLIDVF